LLKISESSNTTSNHPEPEAMARRGWKRHPVARAVTGILIVFIPLPLTMLLLSRLVDRSARIVWPQLLLGAICFLAYRFFVLRIEKRPMTEFNPKGAVRELGAGLLLGCLMASSLFALLASFGVYRVEGFDGMSLEIVRRTATAFLVGLHEEMLLRGIVFSIMEQSLGSAFGVVGSAILFGLGHLPSEGATTMGIVNSIAAGVTLAAAYMLTRRLWLPIGMHIAWNITIGQIFAAVVSGHGTEPGLLRGSLHGPDWLTGGQFGVEGSVVSLMMDVIASTLLLWLAAKRGNVVARPVRVTPMTT
jgi:uncharacterized protein